MAAPSSHWLTRSILLATLAWLLAGCGTPLAPENPPGNASVAPAAMAAPSKAPSVLAPPGMAPIARGPARPTPAESVTAMLDYADRVHLMTPAELGQEIARLGDGASPAERVQLSLALSQLHQLPELVRAQEVLGSVLSNADPRALPLQSLSRLLSSRYGEQRRLSDLLEKQTQQTREVQRRLDQTNERMEALKAIERSLTSRPPANTPPQAGQGLRYTAP